ncbi:MAG: single-stranded-DNA-specific exonuclease RecJ [Gammaproteobacteria bacterium]|nr:single-stranded-DNA-specific exonuclease RecJ [Gammaproteobacteria bacterium]
MSALKQSELKLRQPLNAALKLPDSTHPLLCRVLRNRSLRSADEIQLGLENLLPPDRFAGIDVAVDLLVKALHEQARILIVSDFDADGATSCALAISALQLLGAKHVDYIVPNRFEYGYGLTPEIVELAKTRNPDLIITVDNGISSIDGVAAANAAGIKTLITDHHLPAATLPAAAAIVNPNQLGCTFPSKCIAGVGVIFYVMLALRARLRESGWFADAAIAEPNMAELLDLVALGTVADVVALDRNNRILIDEGLKRIRAGRSRPGILALLKVANRLPDKLTASDLGFSIGPRLNAAGRLDDMAAGIECLLATQAGRAHELALALDAMNQDRKQIEGTMRDQAFQFLAELAFDADTIPAALCLLDARWHQGVVGILASRVKDKFHRPVIAFAEVVDSATGSIELKGSARSIKGFHVRDALDAVASRHPGLISKFGGHAMAAGLSLEKHNFEQFSRAFQLEATRLLSADQLQACILSDGEVATQWLSLEVAEILAAAGPWGQEFQEPVFNGSFRIVQQRILAGKHLKLVVTPLDAPEVLLDAIAFNLEADAWPAASVNVMDIAYRLDINEFRGKRSLQLMIENILGYTVI